MSTQPINSNQNQYAHPMNSQTNIDIQEGSNQNNSRVNNNQEKFLKMKLVRIPNYMLKPEFFQLQRQLFDQQHQHQFNQISSHPNQNMINTSLASHPQLLNHASNHSNSSNTTMQSNSNQIAEARGQKNRLKRPLPRDIDQNGNMKKTNNSEPSTKRRKIDPATKVSQTVINEMKNQLDAFRKENMSEILKIKSLCDKSNKFITKKHEDFDKFMQKAKLDNKEFIKKNNDLKTRIYKMEEEIVGLKKEKQNLSLIKSNLEIKLDLKTEEIKILKEKIKLHEKRDNHHSSRSHLRNNSRYEYKYNNNVRKR